jgi:hypothetical protein
MIKGVIHGMGLQSTSMTDPEDVVTQQEVFHENSRVTRVLASDNATGDQDLRAEPFCLSGDTDKKKTIRAPLCLSGENTIFHEERGIGKNF